MNKVSVELVTVTPEKAKDWLEHNTYSRQRVIRPKHIRGLVATMQNGDFAPGTQISFGQLNGSLFLLNGQHTLSAIRDSNTAQVLAVRTLEVESEEELGRLYITEDRHLKRSISDFSRALNLSEELGLTASQVSKTNAAIRYILSDFVGALSRVYTDQETIANLKKYAEAAQTYYRLTAGMSRDMKNGFIRAPTIAVGLVTIHHARSIVGDEQIANFWNGAALGINLEADDPRIHLQRHLVSTHLATGFLSAGNIGAGIELVHGTYSARFIAACWNAHVLHNPFEKPGNMVSAEPINIAFTPYENKDAGY